jgi:hypothetical protein
MSRLKWSPMLEQYFGMKAKHPDAILLSRVGDFYEAYGDDAETIARALADRADLEGSRRRPARSRWRACRITRSTAISPNSFASGASSRWPNSSKRRSPTSSCGATSCESSRPGR